MGLRSVPRRSGLLVANLGEIAAAGYFTFSIKALAAAGARTLPSWMT